MKKTPEDPGSLKRRTLIRRLAEASWKSRHRVERDATRETIRSLIRSLLAARATPQPPSDTPDDAQKPDVSRTDRWSDKL